MFTLQETYDHVAVALVKQGRPALRQGQFSVLCCYFAENGDRCAAGHCFEKGADWRGEREPYSAILQRVEDAGHSTRLVQDLQTAHDSATNRDNWLSSWVVLMRETANNWKLSTLGLDAALAQAGVDA